MSFFSFVKRYTDLGVGTGSLGLRRQTTIPATVPYMGGTGRRKWNIQRSLGPVNQPGFMITNQQLVPVPLTGSFGIGLAGQYVGQSLVKGKNQ